MRSLPMKSGPTNTAQGSAPHRSQRSPPREALPASGVGAGLATARIPRTVRRVRGGGNSCSAKSVLISAALLLTFVGSAAKAESFDVVLSSPPAGEVLFGEVEIAFEIFGRTPEELRRVEIFVDDRFIERLDHPPWRTRVDLGEENQEHRFEVIAEALDGARATALLVSKALRVDLEVDAALQQLYVTVTDDAGRRVLDLERGDFEIFDDGERQEIITFERGDVPLVALLLVDGSESMRGRPLDAAVAGATAFVSRLEALDQAQVVLFADRLLHQTPFTNFPEVLRAGLSGIEARGGTALADHLYLALERLETRQGRRVLILLSDGLDVSSLLDMAHISDVARRSRSLVYWLRLGGDKLQSTGRHYTAWRGDEAIRRQLEHLETLVLESGGRIDDLERPQDAAPAFERIAQELREQFVLGYYPSRSLDDGSWHQVEVRVEPRNHPRRVDIRHRQGYVD